MLTPKIQPKKNLQVKFTADQQEKKGDFRKIKW